MAGNSFLYGIYPVGREGWLQFEPGVYRMQVFGVAVF